LETIVVDDGSTDDSGEAAARAGATVLRVPDGPRGPAVARNVGARAPRGDILFFLHAHLAPHRDTLAAPLPCFARHPHPAAFFGSSDAGPEWLEMLSQYRNLLHHFVHQNGRREASAFWAGCGAIRRQVFEAVGGFDEQYDRPSIEDIELGARLKKAGRTIWL